MHSALVPTDVRSYPKSDQNGASPRMTRSAIRVLRCDAENSETFTVNERPCETLQFETPAERFNACVASIG